MNPTFTHFSALWPKLLLGHLMLFIVLLSGCGKSDSGSPAPAKTTTLIVTVNESNGNPSSGASVTLYTSQSDYNNRTNPIASKTTGTDGKSTFVNLSPIIYYFSATNGNANNTASTTRTSSALLDGQENQVATSISDSRPACEVNSTSGLILTNNSNNPYDIEVNGIPQARMPGRTTSTLVLRAGSYTLKATQVSGFIFSPTIVNNTLNAVACQNYTWQFP
jgi:hypothetical protein